MKKALLILFPVLLLLLTSCKKDPPDFTGYDPIDQPDETTYLPSTKGTYWKYDVVIAGAKSVNTITLTGNTPVINGKTYLEFTGESTIMPTQTGYYSMNNHEYTVMTESQGSMLEFLYLKDNAAIGETWTAKLTPDGLFTGLPARLTGKMVEKDISKTVSGKVYKGVVHTQLTIQYNFGNGFQDYGIYDYYLTKSIGLLETDSDVLGIIGTTTLTEYNIKK